MDKRDTIPNPLYVLGEQLKALQKEVTELKTWKEQHVRNHNNHNQYLK